MGRLKNYVIHDSTIRRHKIIDNVIPDLYEITHEDDQSNKVKWFDANSIWGLSAIGRDADGLDHPEIKAGQKDYTDLRPNDSYKSMAFFYDEGDAEYTDNGYTVKYTMNLIVFFNQSKITGKWQEIKDFFIRDCEKALRKNGCDPINMYFGRENIYEQFRMKYFKDRFAHAPYDAFRIKFEVLTGCDKQEFIR